MSNRSGPFLARSFGSRAMTFILAHPYLCSAAAIWLPFVILGWLFIAGAAIASADNDKHKPAPPLSDEDARIAHRAAVEAGYADLAGYVEKYGIDA